MEDTLNGQEQRIPGPILEKDGNVWKFNSQGVSVQIREAIGPREYKVSSGKNIIIDPSELRAEIDFLPLGRGRFQESETSQILALGVNSLTDFFTSVDRSKDFPEGRLSQLQWLTGKTNLRLALIAEKLGFEIANKEIYTSRLKEASLQFEAGQLTADQQQRRRNEVLSWTVDVVAELPVVKQRLEDLKKSGLTDKINRRSSEKRRTIYGHVKSIFKKNR